jgi:hypothetical protein
MAPGRRRVAAAIAVASPGMKRRTATTRAANSAGGRGIDKAVILRPAGMDRAVRAYDKLYGITGRHAAAPPCATGDELMARP